MKKILSVVVCLLLLAVLATPVFATQTATMTVKASKAKLKPGDQVTFTVSMNKVDNCNYGGFKYEFDESVFAYESGKSMAGLKGFFAGVSTAAGNVAGFFMNGIGAVEGDLFSVTLKVKDNAKNGVYTITGKPSLSVSEGDVTCSVQSVDVTVTGGSDTSDLPPATVPDVRPTAPTEGTKIEESLPVVTNPALAEQENVPTNPQTAPKPAPQLQKAEDPGKPTFPWWIFVLIIVVAVGSGTFLLLEIRKMRKSR